MNETFLVFDVESRGLYGDGFAVGWVVVDLDGKEYESGLLVSDWHIAKGLNQVQPDEWLKKNLPPMEITHKNLDQLRFDFFKVLQRWLPNGREKDHQKVSGVWADWGYPVEAQFLFKCRSTAHWRIDEDPSWLMPAPLQEVATVCLVSGLNANDFPRLQTELPEHNPLNDARHSARILITAIKQVQEMRRGR
jgi:inhibitor of KinA sporulation pathway (predicted exonuclease)